VVNRTWVLLGAIVVAMVAYASATGAPSPFAPASFFTLAPAFLISGAIGDREFAWGLWLIPGLAALSYLVASLPLLSRRQWAWRFSVASFAVLGLGNIAFLVSNWSNGLRYQGATYSLLVVALNIICGVAVAVGLVLARQRDSSVLLAVAHLSLFCWLNWVGFPWFGEMP